MTPAAELADLAERIATTEAELAAARAELDAEVARLVLDHDGDGIGVARQNVATLRDLLTAQQTRADVLRYRLSQEGIAA